MRVFQHVGKILLLHIVIREVMGIEIILPLDRRVLAVEVLVL